MVLRTKEIRFLFFMVTISTCISVLHLLILVSKELAIFINCLSIFRWLQKKNRNIVLIASKWVYHGMTLYTAQSKKKTKERLPNFKKFLKQCILRTKKSLGYSVLPSFSVIGLLSPSSGIVPYIKHLAKVLQEGVDKGYLNECWQNNVQGDAEEKICFI